MHVRVLFKLWINPIFGHVWVLQVVSIAVCLYSSYTLGPNQREVVSGYTGFTV